MRKGKNKVPSPLWKQMNFINIWLSQTFQSIAYVFLQVVVMVEVYTQTESVFGTASVLAVMAFGSFSGGAWGSYRIQRFSLISLLHSIGWLRGVLTIVLGILLAHTGPWTIFLLLLTLYIQSFIGAWYQPARFALLPLIVSKKEYMKANGNLQLVHQLLMTAGWGLGGMLAVMLPFSVMMGIISVGFVLSGLMVRLIRLEENAVMSTKEKESSPAWKTVISQPIIRSITVMDLSEALANAVWTSAFIIVYTTEVLGKGPEWFGYINASYWVGGIAGSVAVIMLTKHMQKRLGTVIGLSALAMGIFTTLFVLLPIPALALLFCFGMGPFYQAREVCQETILQDTIEEGRRASVMAARYAIIMPWSGVTFLIMGAIGEVASIQFVYLLAGGLYILTLIVVLLQPQLRRYQYDVEQEEKYGMS